MSLESVVKTTMDRLLAKGASRAAAIDEIARMLWEQGEMLADTEGGSMPPWDEVCRQRNEPHEDDNAEFYSACCGWWLENTQRAEALLSLDAESSLRLGRILIESAGKKYAEAELDLWRKVERAKGYPPGSLTGAPGVKQMVAL